MLLIWKFYLVFDLANYSFPILIDLFQSFNMVAESDRLSQWFFILSYPLSLIHFKNDFFFVFHSLIPLVLLYCHTSFQTQWFICPLLHVSCMKITILITFQYLLKHIKNKPSLGHIIPLNIHFSLWCCFYLRISSITTYICLFRSYFSTPCRY